MQNPVLEATRPLDGVIASIVNELRAERGGNVATYIPELAAADPDWYGLCVATSDGATYCAGDVSQPFTIQSISKPFAYAMALQFCGEDAVRARVGVEPSGEAFNSISLEPGTGRPLNPMINAGAIAVSSLINETFGDRAEEKMLEWFEVFTGRPVTIDQKVYQSESVTGHRNRAIAYLLRNFGIVGDPVEQGVDLYFRQCSMLVTARDLAYMGATLANRGVNPLTGRQAISLDLVDDMLSVMTTCGMYDYAGQWLYDVGLPAKSGVAGGILAMLPGRMGIGVFSPKLDSHGNSVRGVKTCQELSRRFRLHLFSASRPSGLAVRRHLTLRRRQSRRVRSMQEVKRIQEQGDRAHIFELQGDVQFSGIEAIQRSVWKQLGDATYIVLDFSLVHSLDDVGIQGLEHLAQGVSDYNVQVGISGLDAHRFPHVTKLQCDPPVLMFEDLDAAMEACEESLLSGRPLCNFVTVDEDSSVVYPLEIAERLGPDEMLSLYRYMERCEYPPETALFHLGDPARHVYFLARGIVAVRLPTAGGVHRCLARLSGGSVFGEMSAIDRGTRSSDVWSETAVTCYSMSLENYDRLNTELPELKVKLLEYLVGVLTLRLRNANDQIAALAV